MVPHFARPTYDCLINLFLNSFEIMGIKKSSMGSDGMPSLYTLRSPKAQDLFLSRDTVCLRVVNSYMKFRLCRTTPHCCLSTYFLGHHAKRISDTPCALPSFPPSYPALGVPPKISREPSASRCKQGREPLDAVSWRKIVSKMSTS